MKLVCATTCTLLVTGALPASAGLRPAARPDLAETMVSVLPTSVAVRVTDSVLNGGRTTAPRSVTAFFIAHVRLGGRTVRSLQPGAVSRASTLLPIRASIKPGSYPLVACADERNEIRESDERNNCRAASQRVKVTDRSPPRFDGLQRATTCIPGPEGGGTRSSSYFLKWQAAADNVSPAGAIVYDVYQANAPGRENFSKPTYTAPAGAESFATPPLPDDKPYYFVVRARDKAGNREVNTVERVGVNLCLSLASRSLTLEARALRALAIGW